MVAWFVELISYNIVAQCNALFYVYFVTIFYLFITSSFPIFPIFSPRHEEKTIFPIFELFCKNLFLAYPVLMYAEIHKNARFQIGNFFESP